MDVQTDLVNQVGLEQRLGQLAAPMTQMPLPFCFFNLRMNSAASSEMIATFLSGLFFMVRENTKFFTPG
jgi:hypothetical protein